MSEKRIYCRKQTWLQSNTTIRIAFDLLVYNQRYFCSALEFKLKSGVLPDLIPTYFYIQQECGLNPSMLINSSGKTKTLDWFIAEIRQNSNFGVILLLHLPLLLHSREEMLFNAK